MDIEDKVFLRFFNAYGFPGVEVYGSAHELGLLIS
jgi:hypothetical protein